ncbi:MAG TPA: metallophosphoesterase [Polyangiaceae bacterium]
MSRTIVVGDVHGCAAELELLLEKLAISTADRVHFVGDLVARGPDTRGVLRIVRTLGARAVMGNHERRLLAARASRQLGEKAPLLGQAHLALMHELDDRDWALIESLPYYLDLPEHDLRILHAGVVPGIAIEEQDSFWLTHLRSVDDRGKPSDRSSPERWAKRYEGPPHVVFGHDARAGIQLHPWATGLDSGCVYGRELTALVLEPGQTPPPAAERVRSLVSVPARARYFVP